MTAPVREPDRDRSNVANDTTLSGSDFVREYFSRTKGKVYLCAIRNPKSKLRRGEINHIITRSRAKVDQFIAEHDHPENELAIYFATATLREGYTSRTAANCWQLPSVFADVDDHGHNLTRTQVVNRLETLLCPPTLIVDSGHGVQPAWLFDAASEDAARVVELRKKLQAILASDAVHDAPRLMRLPGSHNSKRGDWLPVEVVRHSGRRYALDELEQWIERATEIIPRKNKKTSESKPKTNGPAAINVTSAGTTDRKRGEAWARTALQASCDELAAAGEGNRHNTLRDKAVRMGTMIACGWIDAAEVKRALHAAAVTCGQIDEYGEDHFTATFADGLAYGARHPHDDLPDEQSARQYQTNSRSTDEQQKAEATPANGRLPELIINEADPTATAKELAALIVKTDNFLFNGYAPVRIAVEENCLPRAIEITAEAVRVRAHEICRPIKLREVKGAIERVPVPLSKDIALLYLNGLEGAWDLRHFRGITTAPILKNDGSFRTATGYDPQTGLWCHNIPKLEIADHPTKQHAEAALARLRFFFRTFPFADAARIHDDTLGVDVIDRSKKLGLDESTFLAALLTAACRQSLDLAPGYLVRGPSFSGAGTGKGLAVKALCIIGSGVRPAAFTSGHDADEFNKRLTAALTEARPAVFLDNFNAKELRSDILASALTEDPAMVRPMGHTKMVPLHTRTFIAITGNAVEIAEDMARRTIATNFDAQMEDPESRNFAPGFLDQVFAARTELLTDALTIWRWGRQTKLMPGKPLGNYERWTQWCRDPLLALGARDPVDRIAEIKAADPRRRELITVFDTWRAAHDDTTIRAADIAHEVIELIDTKAIRRGDGSLQFSRQRVASFLDRHAGTCVGGYTLQQIKNTTLTRPVAYYKLTSSRQED
jgi:hypothetical protein